jgi:hypothetical protein
MSRIKNAGKKSLWQNLSPFQKQKALCAGDKYTKDIWASDFAVVIFGQFLELDNSDAAKKARAGHAAWVNAQVQAAVGKIVYDDNWVKKERTPLQIFRNTKPKSIERAAQDFLEEAAEMLLNCYREKNGSQRLRNLADAIDAGKKPPSPAVDRQRAWLWYKFGLFVDEKYRKPNRPPTFAQIREVFDAEFENNSIDDSQLREMVKELGIQMSPDKKGPKGPRIR